MKKQRDGLFAIEIAKERAFKHAPFVLIILILSSIAAWYISTLPEQSETVIGLSVNHQALLHDEGHTLYLYVMLEDRGKPVRVKLPQKAGIYIGKKVELNRLYRESSDYEKYVFLRYFDESKT